MKKEANKKDLIRISLTDFIDYVSRAGTKKYTKVKQIKNRDEYQPAFDFWKSLRENIIELHTLNKDKNELDNIINSLTDKKKISSYPYLISQYKSFLGRKQVKWMNPPSAYWDIENLSMKINPELGLSINDKPYIIKLYFKAEPLSKSKAELILLLMNRALKKENFPYFNFAILDIHRKKLHDGSNVDNTYLSLLEGEALAFIKVWESI